MIIYDEVISKKIFLFSVFILLTGFVSGILFDSNLIFQKKIPKFQPIRLQGFQYISPLLYYDSPLEENNDLIKKLHNQLQDYVIESQNDSLAHNVSVYFNLPETGSWTTINDSEKYTPASLLKIPTMIVYYNQTRTNPDILSTKLKFADGISNDMENIKPTQEMEKGKSYTIDDLINRMIVYSDNNAKDLLTINIKPEEFYGIFDEIGIGRLDYQQTENFMTVKKYASFFRILYNASYLNRKMSEKALNLLTQVKFDKGIAAGLPQNIQVAHKFGERSYGTTDEKQLHDCGIIYFPKHPYMLCIMTRGNNFENLQKIIATISSKTYNAVSAWEKNK